MNTMLASKSAPDVSAEQRTLDRTRKQLQKLRWIGRADEAEGMLMALRDTRLRTPEPGERRNGIARQVAEQLQIS